MVLFPVPQAAEAHLVADRQSDRRCANARGGWGGGFCDSTQHDATTDRRTCRMVPMSEILRESGEVARTARKER